MNRAERRRLAGKGVPEKDITALRLNEAYQKGIKDGMQESVEIVFYMTAYTINYKLGFGAKRLQQIMYDIYNNIDAFRTGHLSKVDYEEIKRQMHKLGVKMR